MDKRLAKKTAQCQRLCPGYGPFCMQRMLQFQKLTDGCRTTGDLSFDYFNRSLQINIQRCETKSRASELCKFRLAMG